MSTCDTKERIREREALIKDSGFKVGLGSIRDETELFPPQVLAAYEIFYAMFVAVSKRAWVHLVADMQSGKTGVVVGLLRLVLINYQSHTLNISKKNVMVITGMNDKSWAVQTRERVPDAVKSNIYFSKTLTKAEKVIERQGELSGGHLENLLIIIDESHIAHHITNQVTLRIYQKIMQFAPMSEWSERNIRILTVSATDPSKVISADALGTRFETRVVRLLTTDKYQSIQTLLESGRLRWFQDLGLLGNKEESFTHLQRLIDSFDTPHYHIVRPVSRQHSYACSRLRRISGVVVIEYDASTTSSKSRDDDDSSFTDFEDINELLATPPVTHTIIVLKNMFYAAKTLDDTYVGVMWDRSSTKDSTALQSLLGRACGYSKSKDTIVVCDAGVTSRYFEIWNDVTQRTSVTYDTTLEPHIKKEEMMMTTDGGMIPQEQIVSPGMPYGATASFLGIAVKSREQIREDDFEVKWDRFDTFDNVKKVHRRLQKRKPNENGFILSALSDKKKILTKVDLEHAMSQGITSYVDPRKIKKVGGQRSKLFVIYENAGDPSSLYCFAVKVVTRIR